MVEIKKIKWFVLMTVVVCCLAQAAWAVDFPFVVYKEQGPGNHYVPSGRMGDTSDLSLSYASKEGPFAGSTCIKVMYTANLSQGAGWTGVYWQNPANNWGNQAGGYNLTGAKKLTFMAKGAKGEEIVEFKMGGIMGSCGDTDQASTGPIQLTNEWQKYEIDVSMLDLSNIIGGFCFAISSMENPEGASFYLDEIIYE
jgi:hypothetical protein